MPYFCRFVSLGMAAASPEKLQALGRQAEHAMLGAPGGVNTHKGALYSFALLLSALGRCLAEGGDPFDTMLLVAALYFGQQVYDIIFVHDNVSASSIRLRQTTTRWVISRVLPQPELPPCGTLRGTARHTGYSRCTTQGLQMRSCKHLLAESIARFAANYAYASGLRCGTIRPPGTGRRR